MMYLSNNDASAKNIPYSNTDGISPETALATIIAPLVTMMLSKMKKMNMTHSQGLQKDRMQVI
jgi:hypothetical protein